MSKAETTAFKASEHLTKGKWSTQRTLLFTTMLNMDINDLTSVEKALTAEPDYIRVLTVEKHRMLRAMIACVLDLRQRRENQADPWELLRESQLLLDMGLSEEAALKAAEGIAVASRLPQPALYFETSATLADPQRG